MKTSPQQTGSTVHDLRMHYKFSSNDLCNPHLSWEEPEEHVPIVCFIDSEETRIRREGTSSMDFT